MWPSQTGVVVTDCRQFTTNYPTKPQNHGQHDSGDQYLALGENRFYLDPLHHSPPPSPCIYEWNPLYTLWPYHAQESTFFQPHTVLFDRWMNITQKIEDLVYGTSSSVFLLFFFFGQKTVLLPLYLCIRIFRLIAVVWIFLNKINNHRIEWNARVPVY